MGKDREGHGTDLSPTSISWWCLPSKDTQAVLRASGWSVTCGSSSNSSLLLLREPKTAPQRTHQQINQHSCHVTHIHTHAHAIRDEGMHRTVATAWDHLLRNHLLYHIQIKVVQVKDFCLIMKFCQSSRSGSGESGNSSFRYFFFFFSFEGKNPPITMLELLAAASVEGNPGRVATLRRYRYLLS